MAVAAALNFGTTYGTAARNECSADQAINNKRVAAVDPAPILEQAHQIAMLARQLEDTQQMLQYKHFMVPSEGFRYRTFMCGILFAWALVAVAALLGWEYLKHHLQRKQQAAVVGGLKDMDDDTLQKVLGKVSYLEQCSNAPIQLLCTVHRLVTTQLAMNSVLLQVDLPSWLNFPDYERSNWLNSIVGALATLPVGISSVQSRAIYCQ